MVKLAEHGVSADRGVGATASDDPMTGAQRRLASALEERNRQIADLAAHPRAVPIADDPAAAARAMVAATRSVTGDPTWMMAVLRAPSHVLAAGTYGPDSLSEVAEIDDLVSKVLAQSRLAFGTMTPRSSRRPVFRSKVTIAEA